MLLAFRCRRLPVLGAAIALIAATAAPALAAPGATGRSQPLAVSVPAEAASLRPGATGTIPIRVVNPGTGPVTVRIAGRRVDFGDNGRVVIAGVDPAWNGRVEFPARPVTVAAGGYRDIGLTVRMPARISPDLYFLGFLVTPVQRVTSSLTYVNQIGSYVTIDVPGPRARALTAALVVPGFALGGSVRGTLRVDNVGKAAAIFWGENDTTATPGTSTARQDRLDDSLLPIGRSRTITVSAKPSFLVSNVTMRVRIFYPGTLPGTTTQIVLTKHILIVQPAALALLAAILIAVVIWFGMRRRNRKARPSASGRGVTPSRGSAPHRRSPRRQTVGTHKTSAARIDQALARARANPSLVDLER